MTKHYCDQCEAELSDEPMRTVVYLGALTMRRHFCDYRCLAGWAERQR